MPEMSFKKENMKTKNKNLTRLQAKFLSLYLTNPGMSGAECVRKAGYKTKYPNKIANQLLDNNRLSKKIKAAQEKLRKKTEITQDMVIKELAILGFSNIKNHIEVDENTGAIRAKGFDQMPGDSSRALESIQEDRAIKENADGSSVTVYDKIKFKLHDKIKPLELLGKHLGMFIDKHEFSGEIPILIKFVPAEEKKKNG